MSKSSHPPETLLRGKTSSLLSSNGRWIFPAVILPLLLTILPLWLLNREAGRETKRATAVADEAWFSHTEIAARRLNEASHPRFWTERGLRTVCRELGRRLKSNSSLESLEANTLASQGWKFWGCTFPDGAVEGRAQALAITGFATSGRTLMTQTLQEIVRAQTSSGERLAQEPFSSRLRTQFGLSISGTYFQAAQRHRAFAALMDGKMGFVAWDLLRRGTKTIGIVVAFLPVIEAGICSGPQRTLNAWRLKDLQPAYFALPTGSPLPAPLAKSDLRNDPEGRRLLARIRRTIGIHQGPQANGDLLGRTRLPISLLDRPLRWENWRFRLVALDPVCGYLGMLYQRSTAPPPGTLARVRNTAFCACCIGWFIVLLGFLRTGRLPTPGVRLALVLWFAGVVAVPLLLGFSSASAMLVDREKTLISGVQRNIEALLTGIDHESVRLRDVQERVCRALFDRPQQIAELRRCQFEGRSPDPVFQSIGQEARAQDIDVRAIILLGFNDYSKNKIFSGWNRQTDQLMLDMLDRIGRRRIASATPPMPLSCFPPPEKTTRSGSFFTSEMSAGLTSGVALDRVENLVLGETTFSTFQTRLRLDGNTWFIGCLAWTQQLAYPRYLTTRLAREMVRVGSPKLVALRSESSPELTIPASASSDLVNFARLACRGKTVQQEMLRNERHLYIGLPSSHMPGFVLAARISLVEIEREIANERRTLNMLIGVGLALVLFMAGLLSQWLAGPIVRISQGLSRIAGGDLEVTVGEAREDELGQAGASLDAMTKALRERRHLSRFVPPQVLEIAAAGNPDLSVSGRKQVVTILSSDMRNFTTLSERHPPVHIFQMLNRHLDVMTRAIQAEGGVIDRFIGDAVVAIFASSPGESNGQVTRAVRAARAMMLAHATLITERKEAGEFSYAIGIGIESGEVVTGVLGDPEVQLDFSVLGEAVARANDLEAFSKLGRATRIIASNAVRKASGREFSWLPFPEHPDFWELHIPGFQFPDVEAGSDSPALFSLDSDKATQPGSGTAGSGNQESAETAMESTALIRRFSPASKSSESSRPALIFVVLGVIIWMLPFAIVHQSWIDLERSRQDAAKNKTMLRLQDDLRFVEQSLDPAMMASLDLRHRMDLAAFRTLRRVASETKDGISREDRAQLFRQYLPTEIRALLEPLQRRFPSLFWLHDPSLPPPVASSAQRIGSAFGRDILVPFEPALPQVIDRGGPVPPTISDEDVWLFGAEWRWTLFLRLTEVIGRTERQERWVKSRSLFPDAISYEQLVGNLARQVFPTSLEGRVRQVYIHPFFGTDLSRRSESLEKSILKGIHGNTSAHPDKTIEEFRRNLLGLLWLAIDTEELTLPRILPLFLREMRRRGVELTVSENSGPAQPFVALPISDGRLRLAGTAFSGNRPLFLIISRMLDTSQGKKETAAREGLRLMVSSAWLLVGIFLGWRWLSSGNLPAPSLERRLLIAFLGASLPFLLSSWLILERASHEARIRISLDARDGLLRDLARVEVGRPVFEGALHALTAGLLRHSPLARDSESDFWANAHLSAPHASSRMYREDSLKSLYKRFIDCGFRPVGLNWLEESSIVGYPPSLPHKKTIGASTRINALGKLYSYLFRQTSGRLRKQTKIEEQRITKGVSAEETMIGAEFEGFSQGLAMMLGPERMADLTLSSKSIGGWSLNVDARENLLRQTIWHDGHPVGDLQVNWASGYSEPRQLAPVFDRFPDLVPDAPMIVPGQKSALLWVGVPPMCHLFRTENGGEIPRLLRSWKSPVWFELAALASNRKEPVLAEKGTGENTLLMAAFPGQTFTDWIFTGEIRLGEQWKKLDEELLNQRILLLGMLLFAIFLAHQVARRFLQPAAALVEAADRIRQGDYSARLVLERTDEFGVLAGAFNRMARSAEEGRLLGRFVPATARALAADDERSRVARSGEAREVIVLFAGLAGFKKRLATCAPGPLIIWLNHHLETMSRIIRVHGGETNKFIGDKLLAVFTPSPEQPLGMVVPAALEAAREMRLAFPEIQRTVAETGPGPEPQLGIGLVAGSVLAGILGTEAVRLEFTVIGDPVNIASRLSDLASNLDGGGILVERAFERAIDENVANAPRFRQIETTSVKGKTRAIEIYRLLE
ncbi:MAG: adenylate/guanylate cyclase domain-containing protein [Candidatus Ozemobacteraceae bacterium]